MTEDPLSALRATSPEGGSELQSLRGSIATAANSREGGFPWSIYYFIKIYGRAENGAPVSFN